MYNFKSALVCLLLGLIMYWHVENYGYSGVLFGFLYANFGSKGFLVMVVVLAVLALFKGRKK
ncbi:hypothetical protein [Chromobacterium haemolyticum]|uniref:hypothetical protein n=1 Tax=Chromobacterium haemolyticum TaxID=394935 RepID=UPI0011B2984A|nr:hypothetical protein [Chromobacterium haemolyticum]